MCYWQRWPHGAAIVLALLSFTAPSTSQRSRILVLLAALAIAISGGIGVYHAGVEAKIFEGTGGIALVDSYRRGVVGTGATISFTLPPHTEPAASRPGMSS